LGLARKYLGAIAARGAFIATALGLLLSVAAYIALGATFFEGLLGLDRAYAELLFWGVCSLPLLFNLKRFMRIELLITGLMTVAVVLLLSSLPVSFQAFPLISWHNLLLPFGPILFALAGWTAVEPALASVRGERGHRYRALALGTLSVAAVYLVFAMAFATAGQPVTSDTLSGVLHLASWQIAALLIFGLAAILTSYLPMNLELKNVLHSGLRWPKSWAFSVAIFLPYVLVLAGFDSFLTGVELVGGVFLAAQYIVILQVSRKALQLKGAHLIAVHTVSIIFAVAAVLHIFYFVAPSLGLR
jgi:hypothetical protein